MEHINNKKINSEIIPHLVDCIIRERILLGAKSNPLLISQGSKMKTNYDRSRHGNETNTYFDLWLPEVPGVNWDLFREWRHHSSWGIYIIIPRPEEHKWQPGNFHARKETECVFPVTWIYYLALWRESDKVKAFVVPKAITVSWGYTILSSSSLTYWILMMLRSTLKEILDEKLDFLTAFRSFLSLPSISIDGSHHV